MDNLLSSQWLVLCLAAAVFPVFAYGQLASCTAESFPNASTITPFLDGSRRGSPDHKRYVAQFFQAMESLRDSCTPSQSSQRSTFRGISRSMFADGVASRLLARQENFSFNNARTVVNLLSNSPPSSSVSGVRQSYCYDQDSTGCTDCNTWFNDLFMESLIRSTLESQTGITAAGLCFRQSTTEMHCWDATANASVVSTGRRNVLMGSCNESWLWQKPMEDFQAEMNASGFRNRRAVQIVPTTYYNSSVASYYDTAAGGATIPILESTVSSWSTLHSQCFPSGATDWVLMHTTPVIANCSQRLVNAGFCSSTDLNQLTMVGSSWVSASVADAYNITQCGPGSSTSTVDNVFRGSETCSSVAVTGNGTHSTLQCVDTARGFTPHNYVCVCPDAAYLSADAPGNTTALASRVRAYLGSFIANKVGVSVQPATSASCLACQRGCQTCTDSSSCLRQARFGLRIPLLVIELACMIGVVLVIFFIIRFRDTPVIRSGCPSYLFGILISALVCSTESIILFPRLNNAICAIQPWPRHIGFLFLFGLVFGKVWRVQILSRMPPGRVFVSSLDRAVQNIVYIAGGLFTAYLILWTAIGQSKIEIVYDESGGSYEMCSVDYWRYTIHGVELVILLAGCILAQLTRRLVLEWAEFKFLFLTFANASVIKALIAVFYFTLMPNKYPDYLYLLRFFDNLFSITFTIVIIFGHKIYMIRRNKSDRTIGPTVPAKIARNQSCIDTLQGAAEVSLQQLAESRSAVEGKKLETLDAGFLDFLFPCCCGLLSVDWKEDYYGNRARTPTQRGTSQAQGDESMYHQEGQTSSNPTSNEEDSGLPYMGEN